MYADAREVFWHVDIDHAKVVSDSPGYVGLEDIGLLHVSICFVEPMRANHDLTYHVDIVECKPARHRVQFPHHLRTGKSVS